MAKFVLNLSIFYFFPISCYIQAYIYGIIKLLSSSSLCTMCFSLFQSVLNILLYTYIIVQANNKYGSEYRWPINYGCQTNRRHCPHTNIFRKYCPVETKVSRLSLKLPLTNRLMCSASSSSFFWGGGGRGGGTMSWFNHLVQSYCYRPLSFLRTTIGKVVFRLFFPSMSRLWIEWNKAIYRLNN